jgi:hypothetical protein
LQEYAQSQCQQEHAVEKSAEQGCSLPAIGKWDVETFSIFLFRYLERLKTFNNIGWAYQQGGQSHDEADEVIKLAWSATPYRGARNQRSEKRRQSALLNVS